MAHTDPDMTRAYQQGHARRILRVDMLLPFGVLGKNGGVEERTGPYGANRRFQPRKYSLRIS